MQREDILQTQGQPTTELIESRKSTMAAPNTLDFVAQDIRRKADSKVRMAEDVLMDRQTKANSLSSVFGEPNKKMSLTEENPFDDVYVQVGDEFIPRFKNFLRGTDNNERLARQQTTG